MILNNYRLWRAYTMSHKYLSGDQSPNPNTVNIGVKSIGGETSNNMGISTVFANEAATNWDLSNLTSYIGDGTTEPTAMDWWMESNKTNSFTNINRTTNISSDAGVWKLVHTISGVNNSASPITISEIGITKKLYCSGYPYNVFVEFMFVHALLEQPIVVSAGKGFTLTFEWVES